MIIKWPHHVFARLLPPGLQQEGLYSRIVVDQAHPLDKLTTATTNNASDDLVISATASLSEDEGETSDASTAYSDNCNRRVRFDDAIQITTIPNLVKPKKTYPKTPPRNKRETTDSKDDTDVTHQGDKVNEIHLTPRRLSLRSANKIRQSESKQEQEPADTKCGPKDSQSSKNHVSEESPAKSTPRKTPSTRRRASMPSATKSATTNDKGQVESSTRKSQHTPSRATPRRRSISRKADTEKLPVTKADKLKALSLLSSLPKTMKRDLLVPLEGVLSQADMSQHLLTLVVDFIAASNLLHFLSEQPELVETVLTQLRSLEG